MAHVTASHALPVYPVARRFIDRCLRTAGGLFSSRRAVWRQPAIGEVRTRLANAAAAAEGTWRERWDGALEALGDEHVLLAAEAAYVHVLFATDLRPDTKRSLVTGTLAHMTAPAGVPPDLDAALEGGVASTGISFTRRRLSQIGFLLATIDAWRDAPAPERRAALEDPWRFKAWLWTVPPDGGHAQREALLHLVHPAAFEPIVSRDVKRRVLAGFGAPAVGGDTDRGLLALRARLGRRTAGVQFVDEPLAARWR